MAVRERDGKPLEEILSAKEQRVFRELATGATDEQIADRLDLAITTVRYHVRNSVRRMEVADREALAALGAGAEPLVQPEPELEPAPERDGVQAAARETGGSRSRGLPVWLLPVVVVVAVGAGFAGGIASSWFLDDNGEPDAPARQGEETVAATVAAAAGTDVEATGIAVPTEPPPTERPPTVPTRPAPTQRPTAAATRAAATTASPTASETTPVVAERGGDSPRIVFWGEVPIGYQVYVRDRTTDIVQFFEERFGVRVPDLSIHVGENDIALLNATRETLGEGWHVGLARYRDGHLFLHMDEKEAAIERLYFQAIQEHLAGEAPWGPWWLSEGAGAFARYLYREWTGEQGLEASLHIARWRTSFEASPLRAFEGGSPGDAKQFDTNALMVASLAMHWLVEEAGEDSLVAYYRAIGESGDWREAFERTFRLPFEEVYEGFAEYRAEVAGQRREVRGIIFGPDGDRLRDALLHVAAQQPGSNSTQYGPVEATGEFTVHIPDGSYTLAVVCPGYTVIGWYAGASGFTQDEGEAVEVVVEGEAVFGIEIRLPAPPEELSSACR